MSWAILTIVVVGLLSALAVPLIRFNRKRIHVIRAAAQASDQALDAIYRNIEACGTEKPTGCVLLRTNRRVENSHSVIAIPDWLEAFPWAGRTIAVSVDKEVTFGLIPDKSPETRLLGRVYHAVAVPRVKSQSGKVTNMFAPARLLAGNAALLASLKAVCPDHPEKLLGYLLAAGAETFEFDSIDQARIGTSPSWIQDAEFHSCELCKKRMAPILQLPGTLAARKGYGSAVFYLFGCPEHPEQIKTVSQYS
jgi:hypothetical protein